MSAEGPVVQNGDVSEGQIENVAAFSSSEEEQISNNTETQRVSSENPLPINNIAEVIGSSSSPSSDSDAEIAVAVAPNVVHAIAAVVEFGAAMKRGRRREMEDAVMVAPSFAAVSAALYDFFGVYDGHGGAAVAKACRDRLHAIMAEELTAAAARDVAPPLITAAGREWWKAAMMRSFARMDGEVAQVAITAATKGTTGSTAVVALVGKRWILVANCGDSRAVLCRRGRAIPLSFDHKPNRPDELERVEAAGGRVIDWDGHRVLGVLATSRSLGDCYLKPYVSAEPDITVTDRTERDEFLILASDGLWDVVSNEMACKVARNCLTGRISRKNPAAANRRSTDVAASLLANMAMSKGSKDNVSVVVVQLKKVGGNAP